MAFTKEDENVNPESNVLYKLASRFFRIDPDVHSPRFFTRIDGKLHITNIFLALLVIGSTDILFAVDSIPAILFRYLKTGVSAILLFIGAKMLATAIPEVGHFFASHSWVPLAVIVAILIISILMSVLANERDAALERQQVNKKKQWNEE